jgi:hypothetical protein
MLRIRVRENDKSIRITTMTLLRESSQIFLVPLNVISIRSLKCNAVCDCRGNKVLHTRVYYGIPNKQLIQLIINPLSQVAPIYTVSHVLLILKGPSLNLGYNI